EDIMQHIADIDGEVDLSDFDEPTDEPEEPSERPPSRPVIQYALVFDNEEQQQRWYAFIRWLKRSYPDQDTVGGRVDEYLQGIVED
ncbi:MAG: hypothetical protein ACWGQW_26280, partial [bacterium]